MNEGLAVEFESLFIAVVLVAGLVVAYFSLRGADRRSRSAPEHFFGGLDEETHLADPRNPADKR